MTENTNPATEAAVQDETTATADPAPKESRKPRAAVAAKPTKPAPRTKCNYHEGGWPESNGYRAITSAPFVCNRPMAKGKRMCAEHEKEYVAAAKLRAAARTALKGDAPKSASPKSAGSSPARAMSSRRGKVVPISASRPSKAPRPASGPHPRVRQDQPAAALVAPTVSPAE